MEVNINQALAGVQSEKVKERHEGLADLKHIFSQNRQNPKIELIGDKSYHQVLEAIFRIARLETSTYNKTSKLSAKTTAATRLSECASVIRLIVEVGVKKLRSKTVKALIDHIIQTLPTSDDSYCEPLISNYFKSLRTVLEYQPHPEHLPKDEWKNLVDFCNEAIHNMNILLNNNAPSLSIRNSNPGSFRDSPSRSGTPTPSNEHTSRASNGCSEKPVQVQLRQSAEDMVLCLFCLLSTPNAPVLDKTHASLTNLLELLASSFSNGLLQQAVLETINSIMAHIIINDICLTLQTLQYLLPLIWRLWDSKSATPKDSMLTSLIYGQAYFPRMMSSDGTDDCRSHFLDLLKVFQKDYCKRPTRDQLHIEDINLPNQKLTYRSPSSIKAFRLRSGALKAEKPWALLYISASITIALCSSTATIVNPEINDNIDHPIKRRKLNKPLDDLFKLTQSSQSPHKLFSLQVLAFIFDMHAMEPDDFQKYLDVLSPCLSDDNPSISSWAMLVLSSATYQRVANLARFRGFWLQTWRVAARYITASATCRAACQLMAVLLGGELVQYSDVVDIINNMTTSVDLNGPADCVDSACTLWSIIMLLKGKENIRLVSDTSEHILRWLCARWKLGKLLAKSNLSLNISHINYSKVYSHHCSPHDLFILISVCLGFHCLSPSVPPLLNLGPIFQAQHKFLKEEKLIRYLLLIDDSAAEHDEARPNAIMYNSFITLSKSQFQFLSDIVLDFLIAESALLLRDVFVNRSQGIPNTVTDVISAASSLSLIGYGLITQSQIRESRKGKDLRTIIEKLKNQIISCASSQDREHYLVDGILESFGPFLGPLKDLASRKTVISNTAVSMARGFDSEFWVNLGKPSSQLSIDEDDPMDLEDGFESQISRNGTEKGVLEISHDDVTASTDLIAYRNNLAMKICFLSTFKEPVHDEELGDHFDSKSFMRHLTSLRPHDFLACRPFIRELFDMSNPMDVEDARMLLEYLVHKILRPYEFERCEVSLSACLEIMTGLAEMWTHDYGDISDLGGSLYDWFINIALNRGISSPQVHSSISSMLQRVIKVRPEYAKTRSESLPSVRTSLFRVLQEGNIRVKFHVGQNISEIFGLFILTEHDNILEDVISNLPSVVHWQEGIALRLFVLAHLAASWPTLLRRCVYAIFETSGHDPESVGHAKHCLTIVSKKLRLESLQTLFKLFVSQIIYTWFETKPLRAIPYAIFGYVSLAELLQDIQDEVIGQIVMRGKDDEAAQLANDLGVSYEQLLKLSFSKAAAYSISRDIAVPPFSNTQAPGAEARLRKILGKEQYASLINENFPEILAYFYKNLDDIEDIQRGFQKGPVYTKAYISYERIMSISASVTVLPVNQQPSFKARFLVDEIEFLCRRTSYEPESMWSPELYVFVFRELLDTVHSALGSLHACSVLRRIRLLICMAGSTSLELYPLEMALHALRPYLINTHCAEDAIGMVQYLLEYGAQYLKEVPSFLAGMAISTLTSMKVFLGSSQESTTQESQFRATMSKAHDFHRWFANYLDGYISPRITGKSEQSFKALVKAARNAHSKGNPTRGTYESDLLLEIFEDQRSGRCILNQPAQDLILGLLCTTFEVPSNFHDDILGMDEQTALYAPVIWKICRRSYHGQPYLLWVGRILGRAYACTGLIDREMKLETRLESSQREVSVFSTELSQSSRSSILKLLCDIVLIDNPTKIGMAERVLRSIITRVYGTEYYLECEQTIPNSLMKGLLWRHYHCPLVASHAPSHQSMLQLAAFNSNKTSAMKWIQELCITLASVEVDDPILSELPRILKRMEDLAEQAFSYVLHLVLQKEIDSHQTTRRIISEACFLWFTNCDASTIPHVKMLLKAILYLRKQPLPQENTKADRSQWLEIDFKLAAEAAVKCDMFKTALMFLEISYSEEAKAARRSSRIKVEEPTDLLLYIFQNIDEQDAFYGVQQPSSLSSMMSRLEYENAGFKSLSFRGAHYDSRIRLAKGDYEEDEGNVVKILDTLDLNGLSQSFLSKMTNIGTHSVDSMLGTARKLEQWDISSPTLHFSSTNTVFRVFQGINKAADLDSLNAAIDAGFQESMEMLMKGDIADSSLQKILSTLCILTEAEEILSSKDANDLHETWSRFIARDDWMKSASFENITSIISCRETLFSSLSKRKNLQALLNTSLSDARAFESHALLASSRMSRRHGALQNALATATYLTHLIEPCKEVGLNISAAVQFESANVLWDQGEMAASIRMLQDLQKNFDAKSQLIHVGMSELLAKLGHQISEARLEKPDEIINKYLAPAIKELKGVVEGDEAGQVFHEFAFFCDQQLQSTDILEDFNRIKRLRERKESEVQDLDRMIKSSESLAKEKDNLRSHRAKAKQWFDLDDREFQRLLGSRQAFLRQSLENYLQCLKACDKYDNDALRFSALWLEHWDSEIASAAVSKHVAQVGSRKFAQLMNQWSSRLLDTSNSFQSLLSSLVLRICVDHPYHGMYQIFAGSKTKGGKDEKALARNAAAINIVHQLKSHKKASSIWLAVHNTNISFVKFAIEKLESSNVKPGAKVLLRKSVTGQRLEQDVQSQKIPPPTMKITLRADCNYKDVPMIAKFLSEFTVASGISMPKIVTAIGTDGLKYKQLFKGGNDDLRQDSIMEQVFEQVSNLLQAQQATRQRNLGIRTYKVLPLTATSGIIEFVPNTIPLHDYLMPAHQRHFPKDLKPTACRKYIADAMSKSVDQRIKTFRYVTEHFHPVLRYFFMERFENPDEWFDRRLAYTRSTAAISILGHVLGLGDRHGHNILLDEKTGEVVHIDLGIAFEQGRVLPVPEVVPFRLTRDLVDGMGITGTEGVFRRCCEFTLDALRTESYTIMTILDVLRYDPLYSWSLSPLRLKKLQDAQNDASGLAAVGSGDEANRKDEPGEADRALLVVAKKLSKSLSVTATVNELIQQATDERNLAILFAGWASYA